MKKFLITFVSMMMLLFMISGIAYAEEEIVVPFFDYGMKSVEFVDVNEQDVEIYVTDGYEAIEGAEVKFAGQMLRTDENGKALFVGVPAKDGLYEIYTDAPGFGEKTVQLQVEDRIIKGTNPFIPFTVSYWKDDQNISAKLDYNKPAKQVQKTSTYSIEKDPNAGKWVKGAEMSTGLLYQTSTLYDGKIYVIGGDSFPNDYEVYTAAIPSENVRIYDIETNTWSNGAALPPNLRNHIAYLFGDKIYVLGGSYTVKESSGIGGGTIYYTHDMNIYDITNDTWIKGQSLPWWVAKSKSSLLQIYNNKIYYFLKDSDNSQGYLYSYELLTGQLTNESDFFSGESFPAVSLTIYNNRAYAMYGISTCMRMKIYDFETKRWDNGATLYKDLYSDYRIIGRKICDVLPVNEALYVYCATEYSNNGSRSSRIRLLVYDIKTNKWSDPNAFTSGVDVDISYYTEYKTLLCDNKIYFIGGRDPDGNGDKLIVMDVFKQRWLTSARLNNLRNREFNICEYDGKIYVIGGIGYSSANTMLMPKYVDIYTIPQNDKIISVGSLEGIDVEYDTPVDDVIKQLLNKYQKVAVTLDNGKTIEIDDEDAIQISWYDSVNYNSFKPTLSGIPQRLRASLQLPDNITYASSKLYAYVDVTVGDKPPTGNIASISPLEITVDQSVPLEQEGLEHALGVPVTVSLPDKVEVGLDKETTTELNVIWDTSTYNPHQTGKQTIYGDVVLADGITNNDNIRAELQINVIPTEYEVIEASPKKISIDVPAGTTKEEILDQITPKIIDVAVVNSKTSEVIYIYADFTFSNEYAENVQFDPEQLGKQTLIGRFGSNFLDTVDSPYVEVEVNVVASEIETVAEQHINAYQCVEFANIENLPTQATVTLANGMEVDVDVEWNAGNYDKNFAGDQLITGKLVNLKPGIIQPDEERTAVLIVHNQAVSYKVAAITQNNDFFDTDKDGNELCAGFTLGELRDKLPVDKVRVDLVSITEGIDVNITDYEVDFTLDEVNNPTYLPEEEFLDNLYGTLVLPGNISNPLGLMYEFMVQTNPVEIIELEPVSVIVDYYTEFSNINLPDTVYVKLSNGQRKAIGVDWGDGREYDPDPEDLAEDNPVVFNLNGSLIDIPQYVNHYDTDIPQLTITLVLPEVYKIKAITPVRIPETGTTKINLGSDLAAIYDMLESHTATVTLENLKGVQSVQEITFMLRAEDNTHYDAMSEEEVELVAYLNLSNGIENPYNKQLVISVRPTKYTIRTTVAARVNGIAKGTQFADIEMPAKVMVNYTDTVTKQGEVPVASWDGSKFNPDKIGNQAIKGTFPNPLPVYVSNPNNRTPSAIVNVVDSNVTILSAKQVTENMRGNSIKKTANRTKIQADEIDGFIERKYEVELLHQDGSISTEIVSIFEEIED